MTAPLNVYLDVDGVINALNGTRPPWGWDEDGQVASVNQFSIRWATGLIAALNALAAADHVHMHWLTTWEHDAPRDLCPAIGLNGANWPVLVREPRHEPTALAWWKHHALAEHLPFERAAVWIDDDLVYDPSGDTRRFLAGHPNVVPVCPVSSVGLTRAQAGLVLEVAGLDPAEVLSR